MANEAGNALGALLGGLGILLGALVLANGLAWGINRLLRLRRTLPIPMDLLVMRSLEVMESVPALLLILAVAAVIRKPSVWFESFIIRGHINRNE